MSWTQPLCEACWVEEHGIWRRNDDDTGWILEGLRHPARLRDVEEMVLERCCMCGRATFIGIYVRKDPTQVPYPRQER